MGPFKNKTQKFSVRKNTLGFPEVSLSLCSGVIIKTQKPERNEVGMAVMLIE